MMPNEWKNISNIKENILLVLYVIQYEELSMQM